MSGGGGVPAKLGKYEIRGTLGRGAMGVVLDGWDPIIDRRVAIKTLRLPDAADAEAMDALDRFKREAQAAGRLTHPNIVGVFEYGETDELAFIVMEFVEGRSLKDVLGQGPMSTATAVRLIEDVLAGLAYSHGRGVVHRDIKPANIMLTKEDQAKIADFGIARIESSSMTQAGTVMGTPAYMPPEQFLGQTVDRRADIYSTGVMLYQLLTGERPFEGSLASIMHKVMNSVPPRPSDVAVTAPAALDAVVAKAMARRPEDRFDSAAEFALALRAPVPAPPAPPAPGDSEATIVSPRSGASRPAAPTLPAGASHPAQPALPSAPPAAPSPHAAASRSRVPMLAGAAVAVLAAAGAATWFLLPPSPAPTLVASAPSAPATQVPTAAPTTAPGSVAGPTTAPSRPAMLPATAPSPSQAPAPQALAPQAFVPPAATAPSAGPPAALPSPSTIPAHAVPAPTVLAPSPTTPPLPAAAAPPSLADPVPAAPSALAPATPTVTAGLAPMPTVPAAPSPGAVAAALALRLPGIGCSLLQSGIAPDGSATLAGPAGKGAPTQAAERAVEAAGGSRAAVTWNVHSFDGPFCPVLDYLRTLPDTGLRLEQQGGPAPLADGDLIVMRVTMPGFAGYLHVAYLQSNQVVSTLVPGPGYPAQTFTARATATLGTKRDESPGWLVGAPFGTDMIVAAVSTAPLFAKPPPDDQPMAAYVSSLRTAVDALRRRGGTVAVTAQAVDTVAAKPGR